MTQRRVLITGVSSGLGTEIGAKMKSSGHWIVGVGRRSFTAPSPIVDEYISADISSKSFAQDISQILESKMIDMVINCAGVGHFGSVGDMPIEHCHQMLEVNLVAPIGISEAAIKCWRANSVRGTIVNILSTAAFTARGEEAVYCASKAGLKMYADAARLNLKGTGIGIVNIFPGGMQTPFWSGGTQDTSSFMLPDEVAAIILDSIHRPESLQVTDIVINRK